MAQASDTLSGRRQMNLSSFWLDDVSVRTPVSAATASRSAARLWEGFRNLVIRPACHRRRRIQSLRSSQIGLEKLEVRCLLAAAIPSISISNMTIAETDSGTKDAVLNISLDRASNVPVTVKYTTRNATATAGWDYVAISGTLTIPPGKLQTSLSVSCLGDMIDEADETFEIVLFGQKNAKLLRSVGTVTIQDNNRPVISMSDVAVSEGIASAVATVNVTLSRSVRFPVSVSFQTQNRTAIAGQDYQARSGLLTIPAGQTSGKVNIPLSNDVTNEPDESFLVQFSSPVNATLSQQMSEVTILDDDAPPIVSIPNATTPEGSTGVASASVPVFLSAVSGFPITVSYTTADVTATSGVDYRPSSGSIVIPAGQTKGIITIPVFGDKIDEPNEALEIILTQAEKASIGKAVGLLTINDDDGTQLPLFQKSDLTYLGAFAVPTGSSGASTFEYGGNALAFNPENNSLFMAANYDAGLHISEVKIPGTLNSTGTLKSLPLATVLQRFVDLGGLLTTNAAGEATALALGYENLSLGGLLVANGGLTGGMFMGYNGAEPHESTHSHFRTNGLNLASLNASTFSGLLDIRTDPSLPSGRVRGGYMAAVPEQWRAWIGADYVTGAAAQNRIQFSSSGPALFGFDAVNPQGSSGTPLVYYPYGHALQWTDAAVKTPQLLFNGTTQIDGVAFVPGTRSVVFFGSNGVSQIGYGVGPKFNDKARPYQGFHSQNGTYKYQLWAYDVDDFMAVRNRTRESWEIRPTSVLNFDLPTAEGSKYLGGTAFDPSTGRLYVSQKFAGINATPVIHVYQLGRPPAKSMTASGFKSASISKASSIPLTTTINGGLTPSQTISALLAVDVTISRSSTIAAGRIIQSASKSHREKFRAGGSVLSAKITTTSSASVTLSNATQDKFLLINIPHLFEVFN